MRHFLLLCIALIGCRGQAPDEVGGWKHIPEHYARSFEVWENGPDRRLLVFGPGGRQDTVATYLVSRNAPAGFRPLDRICVVGSAYLPFISAIDRSSTVVGVDGTAFIRDPEIKAAIARGAVREIGTADGVDREQLLALAPEAILDHPFGKSLSDPPVDGVRRIMVTEYLEEHPLGRAEWLRFFGVLLGAEAAADSMFQAIVQRYEARSARSPASDSMPLVFFGSTWQGQWFAPPAHSYMATLITDAGGEYVFNDRSSGGNKVLDLEGVLEVTGRVDHFGMVLAAPGQVTATTLVGGEPRLADKEAIATGGFYGNSETADLFGQAILEPERVLADLQAIFHPTVFPEHVPVYFRPVDQ
ncbi:MAG: ABC transporter substrate-binding protein [Flavobacteriales bacterium]|nr:ABC transporter substrate-binding protein [Flavobacteriales bacterium]